MPARPSGCGYENRRIVLPESENVGVTFGVAWPHVARHLGIGNTVKPRAYAAHLGHLLDRLATAFSLRIGPEDDALADMAISSNQPRIASGREQVRFSPIENALRLRLLPFKQGRSSIRPRAEGLMRQVRLFVPIRTRSRRLRLGRPPRLYQ